MKRHLQVIILAIGFDLYWGMVVLFRERGLVFWIVLALLALFLLPSKQRLYALSLAAAGCGMDALYTLVGLIEFHSNGLLPLWMAALWLMFAAWWTHLSFLTTQPGWFLALIAAFSGPFAYLIGQYLGAIFFLEPPVIVVSCMVAGWLVMMLFFHYVVRKL